MLYIFPQWSGLGANCSLPANVHVLTLDQFYESGVLDTPRNQTPYLLRLEHFYQVGEDPEMSKPVSVNLKVSLIL